MQISNGEIVIHTSDRTMFRRCRRKAYYASKLWHGLRPIRVNSTLWLGTGIHKAIEMYYGYGHHLNSTFTAWAEEEIAKIREAQGVTLDELEKLNETISLGHAVLNHYKKFAEQHDDFSIYMVNDQPAVEVMFKVPIYHPGTQVQLTVHFISHKPGMTEEQVAFLEEHLYVDVPVFYGGRFDMIVEDTFGDLWIVDHKTARSFTDWSKLSIDTQVGSYIWAAENTLPLDRRINGVIYNGLKKTVPHPPELLKKGGLSKNKQQNTTYELYLDAIQQYNLDPDDYVDILEYFKEQITVTPNVIETKYFRREKTRRSADEVRNIYHGIYQEALDMIRAQFFYPNPTRDCSWDCDFVELCRSLYNNEDVGYMIDTLFEKRPDEEDEFSIRVSAEGGE